jgi:hypothetical protein
MCPVLYQKYSGIGKHPYAAKLVAISGASKFGQYPVVFLIPYGEGSSRIPERKVCVSNTIVFVPG